ncbi:MAG TPA: CPBP family intramembrane glutamic endopeptidase [Longimicrobiaceae bacterium]|nr:CPBP family intramembrane glutamic endopeptidase [Longimicrobiaceae bacterium]
MRNYLRVTRSFTYSLLFAAPLLVLYEVGAALLAGTDRASLRNGADVLLRSLLAAGGIHGTAAFAAVLLGAGLVLVIIERRRERIPLRAAPFVGMAAESVLYAALFGLVVGTATRWVMEGTGLRLAVPTGPVAALGLREGVVLSLGAGIYEELVFRVLLVGGLWVLLRSSGLRRTRAGVFAAILAALVFSAFHYIGPYGDAWSLQSFLFRFLAGLAFSVLFLVRGFGITAWTHALYDIFLFVLRGF